MPDSAWTPVQDTSAWKPVNEKPEFSIGGTLKEYWNKLAQTGQGMVDTIQHPIEAGKSYVQQTGALFDKAVDSFKKGNHAEGVMHSLHYLLNGIPGMGAALDEAGEKAAKGDYQGAIADTGALATLLAGPKMAEGGVAVAGKVPELIAKIPPEVAKAGVAGTGTAIGVVTGHPYVGAAAGAYAAEKIAAPLLERLKASIATKNARAVPETPVETPSKIVQAEAASLERPSWRQDVVDELNKAPEQGNAGLQDSAAVPPPAASPPASIPRAVNNRLGVADRIADHLHNAGITTADLAKLEGDGAKLFWDQTGTIPGISKQTHYSPSPPTIEAAKTALLKREKLGVPTIESAKQPIPANLRNNPAALRIAEQLQQEMLRP